nr:hypothetical protein [Tolivirales sp.]
MIGFPVVVRARMPAQFQPEDRRPASDAPQDNIRANTGVVGFARRLVHGGIEAAEGAVSAIRDNRYGITDFLVGFGAVVVVASDRVGYIRSYLNQQEAVRAAIAAQDASEAAELEGARASARAACFAVQLAQVAAVVTLTRFMRRHAFCSAVALNERLGDNHPHRMTITNMLDNSHGSDINGAPVGSATPALAHLSDFYIGTVNEHRPRVPFGPQNRPPGWVDSPPPASPPAPAAPAAPQQVSVFKRGPLFSSRCEWKDQMEDEERAAEAVAQFLSVGTNDEADVAFMSGQGFWTRLLNRWYIRHKSYHRASNKFCKRLRILRQLREEMIFTGVGHKRERSALNLAAAEELAKKVVTKAIDDKVIPPRDARWFKNGLVETYFVKDDDDTFWAGLAAAPQAVRA